MQDDHVGLKAVMMPDTAISHALHAGEDVGYVRGWNAAIEAAAAKVQAGYPHDKRALVPAIRQLKKDTGNVD